MEACPNECGEIVRKGEMTQHEGRCLRRLQPCHHCSENVILTEMSVCIFVDIDFKFNRISYCLS